MGSTWDRYGIDIQKDMESTCRSYILKKMDLTWDRHEVDMRSRLRPGHLRYLRCFRCRVWTDVLDVACGHGVFKIVPKIDLINVAC